MTSLEVGKELVKLCNAHKNLEAVDKLYDQHIVSIEAMSMPDMPARMEGLKAVKSKNQWWLDNHEVHSGKAEGPWPNGDKFVVNFDYDVTSKAGPMKGQRMQMKEVALYTVKNGKIVQEEFYYPQE